MKEEVSTICARDGVSLNDYIVQTLRDRIDREIQENALSWFIRKYCDSCNKHCKVGSLEMVTCMLDRLSKGEREREREYER